MTHQLSDVGLSILMTGLYNEVALMLIVAGDDEHL